MLTIQQVKQTIRKYYEHVSLGAFIDGESKEIINVEAQRVSASLIKPFIFYYILKRGWDLDDKIPLVEINITEDSILRFFTGSTVTLRGLISLMIDASDNAVSNYFLDRIGIDELNDFLRKEGFSGTLFERKFLDFQARNRGRENHTTVTDLRYLYHGVLSGKSLDQDCQRIFVSVMKNQFDRSKFALYFPDIIESGGKSGVLDNVWNDLIFFNIEGRTVLIIAMTENIPHVIARDLLPSYSYHFGMENFPHIFI